MSLGNKDSDYIEATLHIKGLETFFSPHWNVYLTYLKKKNINIEGNLISDMNNEDELFWDTEQHSQG